MKEFVIEVSHTEYAKIQVKAENIQKAESIVSENMDCANWGNNEMEILNVKEVKN